MTLLRTSAIGLIAVTVASLATAAPHQSHLPLRVVGQAPVTGTLAQQQQAQTHFNRFIVQYRPGAATERSATNLEKGLVDAASRAGLSMVSGRKLQPRALRRTALGSHVISTAVKLDPAETQRFLAQLRSDPDVAWAQPDYLVKPSDTIPDDPHYARLQWDMHDPVGGVDAPRAWDTGTGEGTVVAVIDTGYVDHVDLSANIVPGYDFISWYGQTDDGDIYPDIAGDGDGRDPDAHDQGDWTDETMLEWCGSSSPSSWHGTHVAGTVAAVANNGIGIAGLAHGARVQPIRVMGHCGGLTSDIIDAIVWASGGRVEGVPDNETPAEVLNLSLGANIPCALAPAMQAAVDEALGRGVTVVVAAGNAAMPAGNHSPASCKGVITVGATGVEGGITFYSNFGPEVTLSAPGGGYVGETETAFVWSTGNSGTTTPVASPEGDVLLGMVGTSMAAPHVAAIAAMMQSAAVAHGHDPLTPAQIKLLLKGTVRPFAYQPPPTQPIGTGIANAAAAIEAASRGYDERDAALPLANRVALNGIGGEAREDSIFKLSVTPGTRSLILRTYGGIGSVALYVARDDVPTPENYLARSDNAGNTETITLANPTAGTYYLRLTSPTLYQSVSVIAVAQ
jgi:serine protease